jgi:N6-L-threonylcarbamoyladenine synthase
LLYHIRRLEEAEGKLEGQVLYDTAASYQEAIVDVLCRKTAMAAEKYDVRTVVLCGGVACNSVLRERLPQALPQTANLRLAERKYCTDNAAMVGGLAHYYFEKGEFTPLDVDAFARLPLISTVPFVNF